MDSLLNFKIEENFSLRLLFTEEDLKNLEEEILLLIDFVYEKNFKDDELVDFVVNNMLSFELNENVKLSSFLNDDDVLNFKEECNLLLTQTPVF